MSRKNDGEKYIKGFTGFTHFLTMLYAVIMRFDSLREIEAAMTAEVRKLHHIGIDKVPKRSTLSDANARRSEKFFEDVYRDLYQSNRDKLSSDSRRNGTEEWVKRLRIIDSTTITLFSNAIKIQIWGTLIANLLLSLLQTSLERRWSFSGLATMVRIVMMEYLNMKNFFNMP